MKILVLNNLGANTREDVLALQDHLSQEHDVLWLHGNLVKDPQILDAVLSTIADADSQLKLWVLGPEDLHLAENTWWPAATIQNLVRPMGIQVLDWAPYQVYGNAAFIGYSHRLGKGTTPLTLHSRGLCVKQAQSLS